MKKGVFRWLMPILRYGLCAAAIFYLVTHVPWHDQVALKDGTKVRLLEEDTAGGTLVVLRDGERTTITFDEVKYDQSGTVPVITYGIPTVVSRMNVRAAILAILLFLPVPILQSIRLVWMLAVQDMRLTYWNSFKLSFAGNFFNFALPGIFGGDAVKAYYVSHYTHAKTEAVTTVFLDRIIGLIGLMIVASGTFVFAWGRIDWDPAYRNTLVLILGSVWGGLAFGCVFLFSKRLRHLLKLPELAARLPGAGQILRIGRATVAMRERKAYVLAALANTVVLQFFVVLAAYTMSQALRMQGDFTLYFICVPIGFLIAAVPISPPQAFGVMEWAYVQFFTQGALNPVSAAVAFALANRLTQLFWALPGVLVPLLGAHLPSKAELEALQTAAAAEPNGDSDAPAGDSPDTQSAAGQ